MLSKLLRITHSVWEKSDVISFLDGTDLVSEDSSGRFVQSKVSAENKENNLNRLYFVYFVLYMNLFLPEIPLTSLGVSYFSGR